MMAIEQKCEELEGLLAKTMGQLQHFVNIYGSQITADYMEKLQTEFAAIRAERVDVPVTTGAWADHKYELPVEPE